jgi:hypothetical protein
MQVSFSGRWKKYLKPQSRKGQVIIGAVIVLGVVGIVLPLVYLIQVQVGNTIPTSGLATGQTSTLTTLINSGGSALTLTSVSETVLGAAIVLLAVGFIYNYRGRM